MTSVNVESIVPQGLRGIDVHLAVGVDNPAFQVGLEDIAGALKHSGKVIGRMTVDPFVLWARSAEIYHLRAFVTMGEDATLRDLLMLADTRHLNECMIDGVTIGKETYGLLIHIINASHGHTQAQTMEAMVVQNMNRLSAELEMYENCCTSNKISQNCKDFVWSKELKREITMIRRDK